MTGQEFVPHPMNQEQSVAQALSCGLRTRAGSISKLRAWAYSTNAVLNLGAIGSDSITIALSESGMITANTPPKKLQACSKPSMTSGSVCRKLSQQNWCRL